MSVVVFAESWNGTFKKGTFEILTYAHDVAKKMDTKCVAVTNLMLATIKGFHLH
jgi:hypothetical protein